MCVNLNVDRLTKEQRLKNMRAIKPQGSAIEVTLSKALWNKGYRYKKNDKSVFGKPDLTFKKLKVAVFVDSEFWHGKNWSKHKHDHKSNQEFWHTKIEKNIARDEIVNITLKKEGWSVIRLWGNEIKKNVSYCVLEIEKVINIKKKDALHKSSPYRQKPSK